MVVGCMLFRVKLAVRMMCCAGGGLYFGSMLIRWNSYNYTDTFAVARYLSGAPTDSGS